MNSMRNTVKSMINGIIPYYMRMRKLFSSDARFLFFGTSPMNYTMFKPLHKAIEQYSNSKVFFAFENDKANYDEYVNLGVPRSRIVPVSTAVNRIWDAVFLADFELGRFRWKSVFIQINHGVAAKTSPYNDEGPVRQIDYRFHPELPKYDIVFFPNKKVYSGAIERGLVNSDSGYIVGMCCLDEMIENQDKQNARRLKAEYIPAEWVDKDIILYAPTFGDNASYNLMGDQILGALSGKDALVIVKPHPRCLDAPVGKSNLDIHTFMSRNFPRGNYRIVTSTPYEVMPLSDIMISDFSSITFEYSLLRRPIYLFVGDNPTVSDKEQLEALKRCCFVFGEHDSLDPEFFSSRSLDPDRISAMDMLEEAYIANSGTATSVAMDILFEKKVIVEKGEA